MTARRTDQVSAFVKKAIIAGVGTKEHVDPVRYALTRWGVDCPVFNEKAAIAGSGSLDGVFASESQAFFSLTFESSVIGRLPGVRQVPLNVRLTSVVSGTSANWVRQGAAKPLSSAALASVPLAARKIVSLVVLSDELLRDGGELGERLIRDDLARACVDGLNAAFLGSQADDGETPQGILNNVTVTAGSGDVGESLSSLLNDFSGDLTRSAFIGHPSTFANLSTSGYQRIGLGGGFLLGAVAVASRHAPLDRLIIVDPAQVAVAGGAVQIRSSREGTVQMDSNPTMTAFDDGSPPTPTATSVVSLYQTNAVGYLAEVNINWSVQPGGVAALDVSGWGGSP